MNTTETTTKFDLYQTVTDRIVSLLEQGTIPWRKPWSSLGPPMNAISKRPYQGINLWMLLCLPYESNLYLTWEQLKKVNGSVNRGETGHIVVYWQLPENKSEEDEEVSGNEKQSERAKLRYHKVFNVEQCNGISPTVLVSNAEKQIDTIAACEKLVANMPKPPRILKGKKIACYEIKSDCVHMPSLKQFESSEGYYTTLFHELIHSTGHKSRLNRLTITEMAEFGSEPYSIEELIAELGTCYLAAISGILEKELGNSAAYINAWISKLRSDKRFMVFSSAQAQKAISFILGEFPRYEE